MCFWHDDFCKWRRGGGARPLRQFAHPVCWLAGAGSLSRTVAKSVLQTFRGAAAGTAAAESRSRLERAVARGRIGRSLHRWQLRRRASLARRPRAGHQDPAAPLTRPGLRCRRGRRPPSSPPGWLELCGGARQRAGVRRCRELAENGARKQHAMFSCQE